MLTIFPEIFHGLSALCSILLCIGCTIMANRVRKMKVRDENRSSLKWFYILTALVYLITIFSIVSFIYIYLM